MELIISAAKEFNLEEAKNGALIKTRDGNDVRIISYDGRNDRNQIAAWVTYDGKECLYSYGNDGRYNGFEDDSRNLVIIEDRNVTKEEEELIYEDVCHRLGYGVLVDELITDKDGEPLGNDRVAYTIDYHPNIKNCIPYLYPYNFKNPEFANDADAKDYLKSWDLFDDRADANKINWLYKHSYDINGLVPRGLARNLSECETKNSKKIFKFF